MSPSSSILIAGAGIFGLTAAWELRRRGWTVTVLDPGPIPRPSAASTDVSKVVRADYRVEAHEPPRRRVWSQALVGTPFERLLREHRTEVALAPDGTGTAVTLTVTHRGRGTARLGMWMVRKATRRRLDEALDRLSGALT